MLEVNTPAKSASDKTITKQTKPVFGKGLSSTQDLGQKEERLTADHVNGWHNPKEPT